MANDFERSFDDVITEDVLVVMLGLGGGVELGLFWDWKQGDPEKPKSRADIEELLKRCWDVASRPGLKEKAEQIILQEIFLLATGHTVNGLIRFAIAEWCRKRLEGKEVGAPELTLIERLHRLSKVGRIIRENDGATAKAIVTKIMKELSLKERSAKSLKEIVVKRYRPKADD